VRAREYSSNEFVGVAGASGWRRTSLKEFRVEGLGFAGGGARVSEAHESQILARVHVCARDI
jgi:hypothetical protein